MIMGVKKIPANTPGDRINKILRKKLGNKMPQQMSGTYLEVIQLIHPASLLVFVFAFVFCLSTNTTQAASYNNTDSGVAAEDMIVGHSNDPVLSSDFTVTPLLGVSFAAPVTNPDANNKSKAGLGLGALLTYSFTPEVEFQSGLILFFDRYKSENTVNRLTIEYAMTNLQVPFLARYRLNEFIAFGGGLYFAGRMGDLKSTQTINGVTGLETPVNGVKSFDYGLLGTMALYYPITPTVRPMLEMRYALGLADLTESASDSMKYRSFQLLGGFTFDL